MMSYLSRLLIALTGLVMSFVANPLHAGNYPGIAQAEIRPGWRMSDGNHMAALHIVLEPGWKTYWRAPGDAGIPPQFSWRGSRNLSAVATSWPTPDVFFEQGLRSVGYQRELVIPLRVQPATTGKAIRLKGRMDLGLCKEICIPASIKFDVILPKGSTRLDPVIAAALADVPFSAREAGVKSATCKVAPAKDGGMAVHATIEMPRLNGREYVVLETGNPHVWVAEPDSRRDGGTLLASTQLVHVEGKSFVLDRSRIRITVIGEDHAVDIRGCAG